jgi:tRNA pseudouridine55 synthase
MNGVLVVNKPRGMTSSAVCLKVKKSLWLKKAGHLGTLDPLATGVLPLCLNEGTKLVQFLMKCDKEYVATMRLGIETDTQDSQGAVLAQSAAVPVDARQISACVEQFAGRQLQTPPMYSALKRGGVPLYAIARTGACVPREQRPVTVHAIEVLSVDVPDVRLRVVCSHGTYVRTICHDVGRRLGCGAHLTALVRVRSGMFHIDQAVALEDITADRRSDLAARRLVSIRDALGALPAVTVPQALEEKIRNGMQAAVQEVAGMTQHAGREGTLIRVLSAAGGVIAVVEVVGDDSSGGPGRSLRIARIFGQDV